VVSGYCRIQQYSFVGVNVSIGANITIARDCFIGAGSVIAKDTEAGNIYHAAPAEAAKVGSLRFMKVKDRGD
jgi:acetyltransferase-like isoleucine patch superfamily enzyme